MGGFEEGRGREEGFPFVVAHDAPFAEIGGADLLRELLSARDVLVVVDKVIAPFPPCSRVDAGVLARRRWCGKADGSG